MITIHDVEQGSAEWLALRDGLYTGSNADKLLTSHGKTKVTDGIVSKYATAESTGFGGNFWTKRGHLLEVEAIELFEQIGGYQVNRPGFITNDQFPGCGYSPDGYHPDFLIEAKCFDEPKHLKMLEGETRLEIEAQVQFGMMICETPVTWLLLYNPKLPAAQAFKMIPIRARKPIQANFKRILRKEVMAWR